MRYSKTIVASLVSSVLSLVPSMVASAASVIDARDSIITIDNAAYCPNSKAPCESTLGKFLNQSVTQRNDIFQSLVQSKTTREPLSIKQQVLLLSDIAELSPVVAGELLSGKRAEGSNWRAHILGQAGHERSARFLLAIEQAQVGGQISSDAYARVSKASEITLITLEGLETSYRVQVLSAMDRLNAAYANVLRAELKTRGVKL